MPRPRKYRKVCCLPESNLYGPLNRMPLEDKMAMMSVEEYETLRLIDLEGLTQEECAESMQVARTTVQKIYADARTKIADSLVNGTIIKIEGGDFKLCDENEPMYGCKKCHRNRCGREITDK